ncbi:MAG TPA: EAL domain-containing protein [Rudaea sp.]|nr:EAL domain-containing protein [Rudaea sp.]
MSLDRKTGALLAAACGLALQAPPIDYELDLFGTHASGSLAHLHVGLLLALAMLFRDRIYLRVTFVSLYVGWLSRAWSQDYSASIMILSLPLYLAMYGWTVLCARRMGWPKAERRVERDDVARFALIGLLAYPFGWAVPDYVLYLLFPTWDPIGALNDALQTFFAEHFGISILTLPLVLLVSERPRRRDSLSMADGMVWAMLTLGIGANVLLALALERSGSGFDLVASLLDYRFALVAILTWCALRLDVRAVMPILVAVQLLLVIALAEARPRVADPLDVLGLLKIAFELGVLQLLIVLLLIVNRDREDLLAHLREESQREAITGLRNLNGLRADAAQRRPLPEDIGYLLLANLDSLTGGFGLRAQEALMQGVARRLADALESYHMGTGQFALLARHDAPTEWDEVLKSLERFEFRYAGETLRLTAYLGVAALPGGRADEIDAALDAASTAAQDAALHGETAPMHARAAQRDASSASRDALALGSLALARVRAREIELYFQPIMRLDEGRDQPLRSGEILCRLRANDGTLLLPHMFLREIEARGRSSELDIAVVECLFRWIRECSNVELPRLGVNLTGRSVTSETFRAALLRLLDAAPVAASTLCFEVTETEAIARFDAARRLLEELRARGCLIALDDFGVGTQSLERLRELPFDIVKIDGSFVRGIAARGRDYDLVCASVAVARACRAEIVAEYVESDEIAAVLRELGVCWGQGDYFGAAAPLETMLARRVPA